MPNRTQTITTRARLGLVATCIVVATAFGATGGVKRPLKKLSYDPSAAEVALFDGIESDQLNVFMIPKSSLEGNVFIENKTDKPISVKLPKAVVAVQVLKQGFGPGGGAGGGLGGQGQGGQGGGQNQQSGGGFGGGGQQGGLGGGGGGGIGVFSVPPERTAQIPLTSVCLNHGKGEPKPTMTYRLVKLETYTKDPILQELLTMVGTGQYDSRSAQAATWHLTDKMSWEELAAKKIRHVGGTPDEPYFTYEQLSRAQAMLGTAQGRALEKNKDNPRKPEKAL